MSATPVNRQEPHRIVIATPHARNDALVAAFEADPAYAVLRVRDRADLTRAAMDAFGAQWIFFPHWSWLIPADIHRNFPSVIFHMTDVPYGRGGSPLQNLIARGHKNTRLTALRCEEGLDTGPVYLKRDLSLDGTAEEILQRASAAMEPMIRSIVTDNIAPVPQVGEVTAFQRRKPVQSAIDTVETSAALYDLIRMLDADGYPHAFAETGKFRMAFRDARLADGRVEARVVIEPRSGDEE